MKAPYQEGKNLCLLVHVQSVNEKFPVPLIFAPFVVTLTFYVQPEKREEFAVIARAVRFVVNNVMELVIIQSKYFTIRECLNLLDDNFTAVRNFSAR